MGIYWNSGFSFGRVERVIKTPWISLSWFEKSFIGAWNAKSRKKSRQGWKKCKINNKLNYCLFCSLFIYGFKLKIWGSNRFESVKNWKKKKKNIFTKRNSVKTRKRRERLGFVYINAVQERRTYTRHSAASLSGDLREHTCRSVFFTTTSLANLSSPPTM